MGYSKVQQTEQHNYFLILNISSKKCSRIFYALTSASRYSVTDWVILLIIMRLCVWLKLWSFISLIVELHLLIGQTKNFWWSLINAHVLLLSWVVGRLLQRIAKILSVTFYGYTHIYYYYTVVSGMQPHFMCISFPCCSTICITFFVKLL